MSSSEQNAALRLLSVLHDRPSLRVAGAPVHPETPALATELKATERDIYVRDIVLDISRACVERR
jgi:hypothetical protein